MIVCNKANAVFENQVSPVGVTPAFIKPGVVGSAVDLFGRAHRQRAFFFGHSDADAAARDLLPYGVGDVLVATTYVARRKQSSKRGTRHRRFVPRHANAIGFAFVVEFYKHRVDIVARLDAAYVDSHEFQPANQLAVDAEPIAKIANTLLLYKKGTADCSSPSSVKAVVLFHCEFFYFVANFDDIEAGRYGDCSA